MIFYDYLPHLNAILNTTSAALALAGYMRIRNRDRNGHRRFMISALVCSSLFLVSYLAYHAHAGNVRFGGRGLVRLVYLTILLSHTVLAAAVLPIVCVILYFALSERFDRHKRLARVGFPIWVYVSVTGVLVYLMLYHLE